VIDTGGSSSEATAACNKLIGFCVVFLPAYRKCTVELVCCTALRYLDCRLLHCYNLNISSVSLEFESKLFT